MKKIALIALSSSLVFASQVQAETAAPKSWEASAELGFLKTSGNSDSESLNAKFNGSKSYAKWTQTLQLEALNSSQEDVRSAEKYLAKLQSDYAVGERSYLLGLLNWEKDRFSGYDYQASLALGYGYKILDSDAMKLSVELAPGYRISELDPGEKEEEAIARIAETFAWKLSETATLDQSFSSEIGDSNTLTRFNISLTSQVAGDLSMKVGYGIKHNSDVPDGAEKTDKETSVTLVYSF